LSYIPQDRAASSSRQHGRETGPETGTPDTNRSDADPAAADQWSAMTPPAPRRRRPWRSPRGEPNDPVLRRTQNGLR